jgi:hypothetical protein
MARSLLRQLEQIRRSATYDDQVANVASGTVAEPTVSGSLEEDLNVVRTLMRLTKGTSDWYGDLGNYFDPTNTTSGSAEQKALNLANFQNNTLDAKTVILAVQEDNSGNGYTVSGTSTGVLLTSGNSTVYDTQYATAADRVGLPIFSSTGDYWDEGGSDRVVRIDVLDSSTDAQIQDGSGNTIYAKFHDGADNGGSGDGTDVYVRFYANDAVSDLSTVSGTPSSVYFIVPERRVMTDVEEWEWQRTDFVSSWEGDIELVEDISNLWGYTGASDGVDSTAGSWSNASGNYPLSGNPSSLQSAVDALNNAGGDATYLEQNYITDGESYATSLDALDQQVKDNADAIAAGAAAKYVEEVSGDITAGTEHPLPSSLTYTPDSTAGQEGSNMDVYVGGQLLAADTGANGVNADRDYGETSTSGITFRFNVQDGRNITYMIRQ